MGRRKRQVRKFRYFTFDPEVYTHASFLKMKKSGMIVYIFLRGRMIMVPVPGKGKRRKEFYCRNNDEISFTYEEASEFGLSPSVLRDGIDEVIRYGHFEISHLGGSAEGDSTLFRKVDHWRKYGEDIFPSLIKPRPKRRIAYSKTEKTRERNLCPRQGQPNRRDNVVHLERKTPYVH